ncbi:biotin transporter BioY [Qingshengfaniella alkalisoli]|uniref:Biotin transporter n=1 Tax=Qingshengfaniella alkalisoli TaxID=2599296 RepID=A0A5B8IXV2_9RHOB|nr:biotin transporter BioY [Qingshengfaniella alkalisoli]QDY69478.1 biotin transporter BioY [Qingshengfaniella alkalisoli]
MSINKHSVLVEPWGTSIDLNRNLVRIGWLAIGVLFLAAASKMTIAVPGSPVGMNLGTFAVLTIGAAYGPRLGLSTVLAYLIVGAIGFDVFQSSYADLNGIAYMTGSTGGYLMGYVLATCAIGYAARLGLDRQMVSMAAAMFVGNVLIYIPGIVWLGVLYGWDKPILAWGLTPFVFGDAIKLVLATILFPTTWKLIGQARG